ncbi:acyl-CoA dehydrogenase [Sneathiella chungangensis]|uniref:Acyl-CoA dehydrogenase n=1 Tax=Sneathiella chungangensis TaxID=1418234 RepID=A0A845MGP8_9PROT|nr:acyl-CoA dehydrogenase family protein [Sneathiella chungangensis]MZR22802.1 acyl-CoA dehydrogenase [Sneathiella chungangensis]
MTEVDYNAMPDEEFRDMLRNFIEKECPASLRYQGRRVRWKEIKPWTLKLSKKGWLAPAWPVEHGGMGLDIEKMVAYHDIFDSAGVSRAPDMGIVMIGMLLIRFGSDAQKKYYLPRILACEDIWCQGYSEPGSGSDLASLRTKAILDGDHWVVNGQKIWTTVAQDATDIFMLVRTDPTAKKQEGISFLLARMDTPGITVRPIRTLGGEEEFCEVFFDDVRIPKENIVGNINEGWTMAKTLLGFERLTIGSPKFAMIAFGSLKELAREKGLFDDPVFVNDFIKLKMDIDDHVGTYRRYADALKHGGSLGPEMSILKIVSSELYQRVTELMLEVAGEQGPHLGPSNFGNASIDPLGYYFFSRPGTIYAGSNEIQRNILAKAVLEMPSQ